MQRKILLILCCIACVTTWAQTDTTSLTPTVYNGFAGGTDGWYMDFQVGGNVLFNQDVNFKSPELSSSYPNGILARNSVGLGASISVGKWVMPYWGLRLQAQGAWWKGACAAESALSRQFDLSQMSSLSDGSLQYDIFYMNPHLDFMLSLASCAQRGWTDSRKVDVIPFSGIGYLYQFDAKGVKASHCLTGHFGLQGKYRLTDLCDLNLEVSTTIMPDSYKEIAGAVRQADLTFTVGVTYNIGGHTFGVGKQSSQKRPVKDTVYVYNHTETIIERGAPVPNGDLAMEARNGHFDQPFQIALIEFAQGNDRPKQDYAVQYYNVAAFLSAYSDAKLRLDAYCDAKTGTMEYNDDLALRRAENVKKILVEQYGIDAERILLNPIGAREQVYQRNSLNRIVRVTVIK